MCMKKYRTTRLTVLLAMLMCMAWLAPTASWAQGGESTKRVLNLEIDPEEAGTPRGGGAYEEGTNVDVWVDYSGDFTFTCWTDDAGDTISLASSFSYTIGSVDASFTAHFIYTPGGPQDPQVIPKRYPLVLESYPEHDICWFSGQGEYEAGTQAWISCGWDGSHHDFIGWYTKQGIKLSESTGFVYETKACPDTLVAHFQYNPNNPGDPTVLPKRYQLTLLTQPDEGIAWLSGAGEHFAGDSFGIWADGNGDYEFEGWFNKQGGRLTTEHGYSYTMPNHNDTLYARYRYNPGSPNDPVLNEDADYEIYVMDKIGLVGRRVKVPFYIVAQRPVRELTVSLTFPEGLVPELESFKLTSATNGFQLAAQPEQVERTFVVRLTNGEMPAQSTTMFTFEVEIPEGMNTGRDTSYPVVINRGRVMDESNAMVTPKRRQGRIIVYKVGDTDGDNIVNPLDKMNLIEWLLSKIDDDFYEEMYDVNGDGNIDIGDALRILEIIWEDEHDGQPSTPTLPDLTASGENTIQMQPWTAPQTVSPGSGLTAQLVMNNVAGLVRAFQVDLLLPGGVSFDESAGSPFSLATDRYPDVSEGSLFKYHIDYKHQSNGWWRIIVSADTIASQIMNQYGLALNGRYVLDGSTPVGRHPIYSKQTTMTFDGSHQLQTLSATSYLTVGSPAAPRVADLSDWTGYLPTFVVDGLNDELLNDTKVALLNLTAVDSLGKDPQLANPNALTLVKNSLSMVERLPNVVGVGDNQMPYCRQLNLQETGGEFYSTVQFVANRLLLYRPFGWKWNTVCLPFPMTGAQVRAKFGANTQVARFSGLVYDLNGQEMITFALVNLDNETFQANYPYLMHPDGAVGEVTVNENTIINATPATMKQTRNNFSFIGSFTPGNKVPDGCYYISNNEFWLSHGLSTMNAFRGYFIDGSPMPSGARRLSFKVFDDEEEDPGETTVIIEGLQGTGQADRTLYNLQGQSVRTPRSGVYVSQGRKIVVR